MPTRFDNQPFEWLQAKAREDRVELQALEEEIIRRMIEACPVKTDRIYKIKNPGKHFDGRRMWVTYIRVNSYNRTYEGDLYLKVEGPLEQPKSSSLRWGRRHQSVLPDLIDLASAEPYDWERDETRARKRA